MRAVTTVDINNLLYVDFPTDGEAEYLNLESQVLVKLGLEWVWRELWTVVAT